MDPVPAWRVEHDEPDQPWCARRRKAAERRHVLAFGIALTRDGLLTGAGLAGNTVAGDGGAAAGSFLDDALHHRAQLPRRAGLDDPSRRCCGGGVQAAVAIACSQDDPRGDPYAVVGDGRQRGGHLHDRHADLLTERQ